MKRCLITTKKLNTKQINFDQYDLFIGVEHGATYLQSLNLNNVYYISDFDTLGKEKLNKFKKFSNTIVLPTIRNFVDTEEAIFFAEKLGYSKSSIDLFVNEDRGRKDHLLNILLLAKKHDLKIYGNKFEVHVLSPNKELIIAKNKFKYISMFVFQPTIITTNGLKWDLTKQIFDMDSGTNLISNEFVQESASFIANKKLLIILAND